MKECRTCQREEHTNRPRNGLTLDPITSYGFALRSEKTEENTEKLLAKAQTELPAAETEAARYKKELEWG